MFTGKACLVVMACFIISSCTHLSGMNAMTMRAALDDCKQQELDVLVYKRPDGSVMAIRCLPKPDEVAKSITLRPRLPLPVIKAFSEKYEYRED